MNIAYFLDIAEGLGGAGNLLIKHATLMSKRHNVTVVIPTDKNGVPNQEYAKRCRDNSINYVGLYYKTAYNFRTIDFSTAMECCEAIEAFAVHKKIEFFHSVQLNVAVEYVSRKLHIPHLMSIYQLSNEEFKICSADIYPYHHLCDSLLYSAQWKNQMGIESRCIRPVAVLDEIKFKKIKQEYNKLKILMLGEISPRKNQLIAIKAIEKVNTDCNISVELHIAGTDSSLYAVECMRYSAEKVLNKIVFFHGFVSDIVPLLEDCDCLLCSSTDESFPSSMVEALTYDLTIISTPVAGVPEIFVNKENAFISRDYSEKSIAESIYEYIECCRNGRIREIRAKAREIWKKYFDRQTVMDQLDVYYRDIKENGKFRDIAAFEQLKENVTKTQESLYGIDDKGEKWIYKRGLYYLTVQKALRAGKVYIWGAGKWGSITLQLLKCLCENIEIIAFVDSNKAGEIEGVPIKKPDEIEYDKKYFYSVSFNVGREEVIAYLKTKGLALYENIWCLPC